MKGRIFFFVVLALLIAAFWYISTGYFSTGERAGTLSKLSERGYVFKTYEGVLNEGGYSGETGTLQPRYWDFSTVADSVTVDLRKALNTGERVTLVYQEKFVRFPWNGDTKYFITDVFFLPVPEAPVYRDYPSQPEELEPLPEAVKPVLIDSLAIEEPV
ncbi:MAG: hypothetical protein ACI9DJ_000737 [Algoriphagus sp.]|jgi:hypothetical protein